MDGQRHQRSGILGGPFDGQFWQLYHDCHAGCQCQLAPRHGPERQHAVLVSGAGQKRQRRGTLRGPQRHHPARPAGRTSELRRFRHRSHHADRVVERAGHGRGRWQLRTGAARATRHRDPDRHDLQRDGPFAGHQLQLPGAGAERRGHFQLRQHLGADQTRHPHGPRGQFHRPDHADAELVGPRRSRVGVRSGPGPGHRRTVGDHRLRRGNHQLRRHGVDGQHDVLLPGAGRQRQRPVGQLDRGHGHDLAQPARHALGPHGRADHVDQRN